MREFDGNVAVKLSRIDCLDDLNVMIARAPRLIRGAHIFAQLVQQDASPGSVQFAGGGDGVGHGLAWNETLREAIPHSAARNRVGDFFLAGEPKNEVSQKRGGGLPGA